MTCFWSDLLPSTSAGESYAICSYGPLLQGNKQVLAAACASLRVGAADLALMTAMAMQESTTMSVEDRDRSKDGMTNGSTNYSMFNLSEDLLMYIGFTGRLSDLNVASNLPLVLAQILDGINKLGLTSFLNYVRGGRTAFTDGVSYGAERYRSTIATILSVMDQHPALLTDSCRVEITLEHV